MGKLRWEPISKTDPKKAERALWPDGKFAPFTLHNLSDGWTLRTSLDGYFGVGHNGMRVDSLDDGKRYAEGVIAEYYRQLTKYMK